jgi:hypothetical protein
MTKVDTYTARLGPAEPANLTSSPLEVLALPYIYGKPPIALNNLIDAAMCLWEAALEDRSELAALDAYMDVHGAEETRRQIASLAEACHTEWEAATEAGDFDQCFDWEWCPHWLATRVQWDDTGASLKPLEA